MNLPDSEWFKKGKIETTKRMIKDYDLLITDVGSSAQLHHENPKELLKNMDEAKNFIDLAYRLECKYVRVFPEKLKTGDNKIQSLDTIISHLKTLGEYAKGSNVTVLLESHGDLIKSEDLLYVMQESESKNTGMIWDICNMWSVTKESPTEVYKKLNKFIKHVHVKDAKIMSGKEQYVLFGNGEVPLKEALNALYHSNYEGFTA